MIDGLKYSPIDTCEIVASYVYSAKIKLLNLNSQIKPIFKIFSKFG